MPPDSEMPPDKESLDTEVVRVIEQALRRAREEGKESEFTQIMQEALGQTLNEGADTLLATLKSTAPEMLAEQRELRAGFEARLYERWGSALDLFEMVLVIAQEAGDSFRARRQEQAAHEKDLTFAVLLRLHAHACQTASEVLALLRSGYATAAMARWRTIHEVAVVMAIIKEYGQDIAQRYFDHDLVEAKTDAEEYQRHHKALGLEPYTLAELAGIKCRSDEVLRKYETEPLFGKRYGWAAKALTKTQPGFPDLEKAAKLDHMRPYYSMASHGIHSQSRGILFQLGQVGPERAILAGTSNAGLADPGHATLISLLQCTATFLFLEPDVDAVMTLKAMSQLVDEAGQAFITAHQALVREEEDLQCNINLDDTGEPSGPIDTNSF